MRFVGHCLAADVRRFWPLIAGWLFVVLGAAAIDGVRPTLAGDPRLVNVIGIAGTLLWLTELLLFFVLIALVVQAHPLVGSDAFWMTRPIPPSTLLLSKLTLFTVSIVVAPVIVEIVLMTLYHVPAKQAAFVAADMALTQAALLILLMVGAALTRNAPGFALLCGATLGVLAVALAVDVAIFMTRDDTMTPTVAVLSATDPLPRDDDPTGMYLWSVLFPAIGLAVLAVQYRARSRLRAVGLGIAGIVLASVVVDAWHWPMLQPRVISDWARDASSLRLSADPATAESRAEDLLFTRRSPWNLIRARVRLAGIQPGWSADVALLNATIQMNDGSIVPTARGGFPAAVPIDSGEEHPARRATLDLLGVRRVVESLPAKGDAPVVFVTRNGAAVDPQRAIGTYRGRFRVALIHRQIEAVLPLRAGVVHQSGAYRFVLDGIDPRRGDGAGLIARESRAVSRFERMPIPMYSFYLRNPTEGAALVGYPLDVREVPLLSRFMPFSTGFAADTSGFVAQGLMIRFSSRTGMEGDSLPIDEAWLAGAELVIVRTTHEASVQRELEMSDFDLRGRR